MEGWGWVEGHYCGVIMEDGWRRGYGHYIYAKGICLPHVFLNQSFRLFHAGIPAMAPRSRAVRVASFLDPFVEMEGLGPHLRTTETLGWGLITAFFKEPSIHRLLMEANE